MCALALVLTVPQYYCYHTAHKYIMNEGDAFEKDTGIPLSLDMTVNTNRPMPPSQRARPPPGARVQRPPPQAQHPHPRNIGGRRSSQQRSPRAIPINGSFREFKGATQQPLRHHASPVREEGVI